MANSDTSGQKSMVGKVGITGGSALSILGTLITLLGFFILPWVSSCTGDQLTGYDLAVNGADLAARMGDDTGAASFALLCIPGAALIVLGLSILLVPSAFLRQVPSILKPVASVIGLLLALVACCVSTAFLLYLQPVLEEYEGMLEMESGFWTTAFGVILVIIGTLLSTVAAIFAHFKEKPAAGP